MDKELLFRPRLDEEDVEIEGIGTVRVRGLNRIEAIHVQAANGPEAIERRIMALGMVDPPMTEAEVGRWQKASPAGEIEKISTRIAVLSGMAPGSAKEAVKTFEANPDVEFPVLPGAEAGDDGSPAPAGDE